MVSAGLVAACRDFRQTRCRHVTHRSFPSNIKGLVFYIRSRHTATESYDITQHGANGSDVLGLPCIRHHLPRM
ncbi:hypothetical protein E2C01_005094 [Portunus trituberculatus]|uniref:Uncharacterized protein n=1 Tax=Portunus trituberculatus TaxID=210409 RepID=A0A5B7CY75_PORTR|nr:hypothetical protein [Portunus trituberculatus]